MRKILSTVAVAAWLIACSSSSSSSAPTLDSSCAAFASALCSVTNQCNAAAVTIGFGSVDACTSRATATCKAAAGAPSTGLTPDKLQTCADASKGIACGEFYKTGLSTTCPSIPGSLANGASCLDDSQCASTSCSKATNALCGKCADRPGAGGACASGAKCSGGQICNSSAVCAPAATLGQKCAGNADCEADLRCNQGTCAAGAKIGEACSLKGDTGPQCDPTTVLWCNAKTNKCETTQTAAAGGACGLDLATGALAFCDASSYCKTVDAKTFKGTCTARSADGAACTLDALFGGSSCQAFAVCDSGICRTFDANACK